MPGKPRGARLIELHLRLTVDQLEWLEEVAQERDSTVAALVRELIERAVAEDAA